MRALLEVTPTPEQLALFSRIRPGVEVIRGAAGSGKTTTALLKLRAAVGFYLNRRKRNNAQEPVKVLVLTFNRTLRGYVKELAEQQIQQSDDLRLEISTFSSWASNLLGNPDILEDQVGQSKLIQFARGIGLEDQFILDEVAYVLGRFPRGQLAEYLTSRRIGRGTVPRMERPIREALLEQVVLPFENYKQVKGLYDWNDLALEVAKQRRASYDVVVVDEAQDFSANELRAVLSQLSDAHTLTLVMDTTQRIYGRSGFAWQEIGITVRPENSSTLQSNYRNSKQIARFAAGILEGMAPDQDGSLPNFESATRDGPLPIVLEGRYQDQVEFAIGYIRRTVDLGEESVAFLHPKGGGWFSTLRDSLRAAALDYVEITRQPEWPDGEENIALSTMHSAKGLEFDHVILLGLNGELTAVAADNEDEIAENEMLLRLRRLCAMAVGRAKKQVIIGYKPEDTPRIATFFQRGTFEKIVL